MMSRIYILLLMNVLIQFSKAELYHCHGVSHKCHIGCQITSNHSQKCISHRTDCYLETYCCFENYCNSKDRAPLKKIKCYNGYDGENVLCDIGCITVKTWTGRSGNLRTTRIGCIRRSDNCKIPRWNECCYADLCNKAVTSKLSVFKIILFLTIAFLFKCY